MTTKKNNNTINSLSAKELLNRIIDKPEQLFSDDFIITDCGCGEPAYSVELTIRKKNIIDVQVFVNFLCKYCFMKKIGKT